MKTIMTTAALLAAIGSAAATAQGLPPGYGAWQSGWHGSAEAQQAQAMRAPQAAKTRSDNRATLAQNSFFFPLALNAKGDSRGR
jgi:hypothetical protein